MNHKEKYKKKTVFREKYTDIKYLKSILLVNAIILVVYILSQILK